MYLNIQWSPGYIAISFFVSMLGAATALQSMKYRTGTKGFRNWCYLIAGSVCLGGVGIFSMHFVGVYAMRLLLSSNDVAAVQIAYLPLLTAFSFVVIILIVGLAFWIAGNPTKAHEKWRFVVAGSLGGCGVNVMHYMGMVAMVCEYPLTLHWNVGMIAGTTIIAIVVTIIALSIFFKLKSFWMKDVRVLLFASFVMAIAVCAVHYMGMYAALYEINTDSSSSLTLVDLSQYTSPETLMIVVLTISISACLALLIAAVLNYRYIVFREGELQHRQLLLSAVVLDEENRILLSLTNSLPSVSLLQQIPIGFDWLHADFARLFKASVNWKEIENYQRELRRLHEGKMISTESVELFGRFVIALEELNKLLGFSLQEMGAVMYWKPSLSMLCLIVNQTSSSSQLSPSSTTSMFRFEPIRALNPWFERHVNNIKASQDAIHRRHRSRQPKSKDLKRITVIPLLLPEVELLLSTNIWIQDLKCFFERSHDLLLFNREIKLEHGESKALNRVENLFMNWKITLTMDQQNNLNEWGFNTQLQNAFSQQTNERKSNSNLFVGMLFTQVSVSGAINILIPSSGSNYMIPMVPIGSENKPEGFSEEEIQWIQAKCSTLSNTTQFPFGPSFSASDSSYASFDSNQVPFNQMKYISEQNLLNDLSPFHSRFSAACDQLAVILGTDKHLTPFNLLSSSSFSSSPSAQKRISIVKLQETNSFLLLFHHSHVSPTFPSQYNPVQLQFVPLSIFEALHSSHFQSYKDQQWIRQRMQQKVFISSNATQSNDASIALFHKRLHHRQMSNAIKAKGLTAFSSSSNAAHF
jgi:NO-binding membrane sensor protein with MHYT domain